MPTPNYTPNLNKKQRYLFQIQRMLNTARRIGRPQLIYALQKLIVKNGGVR